MRPEPGRITKPIIGSSGLIQLAWFGRLSRCGRFVCCIGAPGSVCDVSAGRCFLRRSRVECVKSVRMSRYVNQTDRLERLSKRSSTSFKMNCRRGSNADSTIGTNREGLPPVSTSRKLTARHSGIRRRKWISSAPAHSVFVGYCDFPTRRSVGFASFSEHIGGPRGSRSPRPVMWQLSIAMLTFGLSDLVSPPEKRPDL